jgi:hypothetical protein
MICYRYSKELSKPKVLTTVCLAGPMKKAMVSQDILRKF